MSSTELINRFVSYNLKGNVNDLVARGLKVTADKKKLICTKNNTTLAQWSATTLFVNTPLYGEHSFVRHCKTLIQTTAKMLNKMVVNVKKTEKGVIDLND